MWARIAYRSENEVKGMMKLPIRKSSTQVNQFLAQEFLNFAYDNGISADSKVLDLGRRKAQAKLSSEKMPLC